MVLRIVSAYWTVSTSSVLVLASVPLLTEERKETFQLRKELTCLTNLQEIARAKEAIRKDGRRRLVEKWQMRWDGDHSGRWTHRQSHSSPPGWIEITLKSVFTRCKRFRAMVALMRTRSASRKETISCVATADSLWTMQNTHSLSVPGGAWQGRLSVGQWTHNSLLTRWSLSCSSLNRYGCLSSHWSPWWWKRGSSMGMRSAASTRASRNCIGACIRGPASRADFAVRVVWGRNLFMPPLVSAASRFA